jgi:hypothetical protein
MKLGSLMLCASLAAGCVPLRMMGGGGNDERRHESTHEEDAVDLALFGCFRELAREADYMKDPVDGADNVRRALKAIEDAQAIANATPSIAERTWPFPWSGEREGHAPIGVTPGLADCRTKLASYRARLEVLAEQHGRDVDARHKLEDDDLKQAIATVGPQRRSVLRLHGLPEQYKHGTDWQRDGHWTYTREARDIGNQFYECDISYFFEEEKLVASNASPQNCGNVVRP